MPDTGGGIGGDVPGSLVGWIFGQIAGSGGSTNSETGSGAPIQQGNPSAVRSSFWSQFRSKPYTGGKVPSGATVTYSNVGAYEPYRGSPNTKKAKVRRKTRTAKKWVDPRANWEKMLDWLSSPVSSEPNVMTIPPGKRTPEQQRQIDQIWADAGLITGIGMMGPNIAMPRSMAIKTPPKLTTVTGGKSPISPRMIGNTALKIVPSTSAPGQPKASFLRMPSALALPGDQRVTQKDYDNWVEYRANQLPLDEVQVTATKVGADVALPGQIDEVRVTARYSGRQNAYGPGTNPANTPDTRPRPADAPASAPGLPGTAGKPASSPGTARRPARVALPRLGPIKLPVDALLAYAVGRISRRFAAPGVASQLTRPAPASPGSATQPILGQSYAFNLNPSGQVAYDYAYDKCKCKSKRKKSEPRKARSVCYTGTYRETARGLSKRKRQQVPC